VKLGESALISGKAAILSGISAPLSRPAPALAVIPTQRPARIARLHRHADLKIARVILRARQRRDFPFGQLG
jgi:hypothetical protein